MRGRVWGSGIGLRLQEVSVACHPQRCVFKMGRVVGNVPRSGSERLHRGVGTATNARDAAGVGLCAHVSVCSGTVAMGDDGFQDQVLGALEVRCSLLWRALLGLSVGGWEFRAKAFDSFSCRVRRFSCCISFFLCQRVVPSREPGSVLASATLCPKLFASVHRESSQARTARPTRTGRTLGMGKTAGKGNAMEARSTTGPGPDCSNGRHRSSQPRAWPLRTRSRARCSQARGLGGA